MGDAAETPVAAASEQLIATPTRRFMRRHVDVAIPHTGDAM